ncbi:hypothetical protein GCM10027610_000060 [Dactylosporangium cerinum]
MSTRPANGSNTARTSASVACTASIAPPVGSACINRPRAATNAAASSKEQHVRDVRGGELTDRVTEQSGLTPNDSTRRNSATSSANNDACVYTV